MALETDENNKLESVNSSKKEIKSSSCTNNDPAIKKKGNVKKTKQIDKETEPIKANNLNDKREINGNMIDSIIENNVDQEIITTNKLSDKKQEDSKNENKTCDLIQETGIMVYIQSPGTEMLTLQVSNMELVQEIHQLLMDREDTCHRTCFSLQLDGITLDNFAELKNVENLKDGSVIKVVEEPYTMREARIHVRHIRDLLKSLDLADSYNGLDCSSLTFLNIITQNDTIEKKKFRSDSVDCTPPDYIMPGAKERPLHPLHPCVKNSKTLQALKVLTTSAWNPPPGNRKLHGDLLYLYVVTMEDKRFHISACPRGFFINQSTDEIFNPKPDNLSHLCHSLVDLLSHISPSFKRCFTQMQKKRTSRHVFERVATPYQIYSWISPILEHTIDAIRAEDTFSSKLGYEEHIPGQSRDWNEELQTTRELPRTEVSDRLLRERAIFKVHGDFVVAATRGAMAVIDGNVLAINPGEDSKMQMFIWNNIFFSLGFDVRDHYKELGGDVAAFVAPRNDLQGVKVYNAVDIEGLYLLGTVVIDYRGYRVTAQSIIPGILEREQEQSVVYGSIDFGKTVLTHPKYIELLKQASKQLKILPHSVYNEKNEKIELCSSVECKGIIGNDGRHYILDLLRTFPPDVNFLKLSDVELSKEVKELGFPIEHKHKLCCLRQELLDAFVEDRYIMFIKYAAQQLNLIKRSQISSNNVNEKNDTDNIENLANTVEAKKLTEQINENNAQNEKYAADVVKRACIAVGSLKDYEFDFKFNPDVFSNGIRHVDDIESACSLKKQKQVVIEAAEYLVTRQIPCFVQEFLDNTSGPMDGITLTEALHNRGINIRYLGKVANLLSKVKTLDYLYQIAIQELILRATKHIYYTYMQNTEMMSLASAISHFLNCFLTSGPITTQQLGFDELQKTNKRRNKRKTGKNGLFGGGCGENTEWITFTQKSLWLQIKKEIKAYWDYDINCDSIETIIETYKLQRISMLRAFCLKVGIQILLREYNFESRNKPTFNDDDIINVFPIVKHINPKASDAYNFYTTGQTKIQQGYLKEGYELLSEALNLLNNVFGAMHPENAQCLRMLARLSYILGDPQEALSIQQKAVLMSERVNGIDHPYTILEYTHLALYSFANGQISTSLKLLYRARYLALIVCGENHPDLAMLDSNISLILHAVGEYEFSLRFLEHALTLNLKYFGKKSIKVAVTYHLIARTQSCMGDFRSALTNEKETYAIYKNQFGELNEKTQESSECLRLLTQQAVFLQKKMNDMYSNGKLTSCLPPIHISPPTINSVLEMLNSINGVLFVQLSPKDIAKLNTELKKHQRESLENNDGNDILKEVPETTKNDNDTVEEAKAKIAELINCNTEVNGSQTKTNDIVEVTS